MEELKFEDAAELVKVEGWACKKCGQFFGVREDIARNHCSTDAPCSSCGGRKREKYYTSCGECRTKQEAERWKERYSKAIEWTGVDYPIYSESDERYFWDEDELFEWIDDQVVTMAGLAELTEVIEPLTALDVVSAGRFVSCSPNNGRSFEMNEFLCDDLAEDDEVDADDIDRIVNDWIAEHAPYSWAADGPPLQIESIVRIYESGK